MKKGDKIIVNGIEGIIEKVNPNNTFRVTLAKSIWKKGYLFNSVIVKPVIAYKIEAYF